jgi:hypothetical protein
MTICNELRAYRCAFFVNSRVPFSALFVAEASQGAIKTIEKGTRIANLCAGDRYE